MTTEGLTFGQLSASCMQTEGLTLPAGEILLPAKESVASGTPHPTNYFYVPHLNFLLIIKNRQKCFIMNISNSVDFNAFGC